MSYMPPDLQFILYVVKWVSNDPQHTGDVRENITYSRDTAYEQMCKLLRKGKCAWVEKTFTTDEYDDIPF